MHHFSSQSSTIIKLLLPVALVLGLLLLPFNRIIAGDPVPESPQEAPLNPDFVKYLQEKATKSPESQSSYGYIPPTIDLSHLARIPVVRSGGVRTLPSAFDWRTQSKVTPVKNQGQAGTCWIFGTLAALESRVAIVDNQNYDFSEQNLVTGVDPAWTYLVVNRANGGGTSILSTDTLTKKGTRPESAQPYNISTLNTEACNESTTILQRVTDFRIAANSAGQITEIKNAIYNYGPVTGAYRQDTTYPYPHLYTGNVYYWPNCADYANHLICLVGWDDSIPFPGGGGSGAWIVKNSWGTGFGNSGYFYLCYGSANLKEIGSYHGDAGASGYRNYNPAERIYYWDEAGLVYSVGFGDSSASMRSVFTANRAGSLTSVNFWTTSNNAQYEIHAYDHTTIALLASKTGTCAEMGYYSIPLTSPVHLTDGQQFRIDVKMTTPGYNYPIPVERAVTYTDGSYHCNPPIQTGVSFVHPSETAEWENFPWFDASEEWRANVCLRATVIDDVVTLDASNITATGARLNGELKSLTAGQTVNTSSQWGTTSGSYPNETTPQAKTGNGTFSFDITGLNPGTKYYYRVKTVISTTIYGDEKSFTTTTTQCTLTMAVDGSGTTNPAAGAHTYYEGWVNITATPAEGWFFDKWTGDVTNTFSKTATVNLNASKTVTAIFSQETALSGKITFSSARDGNWEIYVMNADGTNQTRLTNNSLYDWHPSWSPEGTKIAFSSGESGNFKIYVMNADGSNQTSLTSNYVDNHPAWSPDGNKIAFIRGIDSNSEIYVMNADGTNQTRLTNNSFPDLDPSWSPDGSTIAFCSYRDGIDQIYLMNADGTNQAPLIDGLTNARHPAWSPDGTRITANSGGEIYVMSSTGGNRTRLTSIPLTGSSPSWSPVGSKIVFHSERDGNPEIYVMNADGSNQTRLTNRLGSDDYPSWAAGSWVAPSVATSVRSNLTSMSTRLNADLIALGSASTVSVSFQWGTTSGIYPNETTPQVITATPPGASLQTHLLCVASSRFQSVADLPSNSKIRMSGTAKYFEWVETALNSYGKNLVMIALAEPDVVQALRMGVIDATLVTVHPATYIEDFITSEEGKLLPWSTQSVNATLNSFPDGVVSGFLPANTYQGQSTTVAGYAAIGGQFSFDLTGLNPVITYYYRAKAVGDGTGYGDEMTFTTSAAPAVVTTDANMITLNSARLNGNLASLGTATSVEVSFQWGITSGNLTNETTVRTKTATGIFSFDLTNINPGTYYYRARAVGNGTSYGDENSFTSSERAAVTITVILQGGGRPNPAGWAVPLIAEFFSPGANVLTDSSAYTAILETASAGTPPNLTAVCQIPSVCTGTYDITIVSPHTLLNVKRNVVISAPTTSVNLGTLLEGNANDSASINISDFGILAVAYNKTVGTEGYDARANFDCNNTVNISDFGLLAVNFNKTCPVEVP